MAKIPFKVSARTARLIGGQNFSNAEGAIIELVKNCYDADAQICIVLFDNKFATLPETLSASDYKRFEDHPVVARSFSLNQETGNYILSIDEGLEDSIGVEKSRKSEIQQERREDLLQFFQSQTALYVIDDGEGMTDEIIENHWMVIGTDNKEEDIFTQNGRVKTGAKGIGRFALDRLGTRAELLTKPNPKRYPASNQNEGFLWEVDWDNFDGGGKIIGDVTASLISETPVDYRAYVSGLLGTPKITSLTKSVQNFTSGTSIKIASLKEVWDERSVDKVFSSLEVLIPPREERHFDIFVVSTANAQKYGKVDPSFCDDFDYKLTAKVDSSGIATISLFRNEHDIRQFPDELFKREAFRKTHFSEEDFRKESVSYNRKLSQLLPGYEEVAQENLLSQIGAFDFVMYFMKFQTATKDKERFLYRDFDAGRRKAWLDEFGGIKLFRDNFRVRPYGEQKGPAFDWLDLGSRASASPAGIAKKGGGFHVRPNNVSGIINISRLTNIRFEDKSSREGLQENDVFSLFKEIILRLIAEFESDRSYIARELAKYYEDTHHEQVTEDQAKEILNRIARKAKSKTPDAEKSDDDREKEILARFVAQKSDEIEELRNEQQLLRVLASNALTIASFTHELRGIEKNLVRRVEEAESEFRGVVNHEKCDALPEHKNPFGLLEDIKNDDVKLKEWLGYSLGTLRKDKRRRKGIDLKQYFENFEKSWRMALLSRGVKFESCFTQTTQIKIRAFEIDIDCIFNNLITNSFEAFNRRDAPRKREIKILINTFDADLEIIYRDSGPGLSKDLVDPNKIFEPHFTTKKNIHTGEDIGTGLGLWLVKSFIEDNKGSVELLTDRIGFGLRINFPNKLKK